MTVGLGTAYAIFGRAAAPLFTNFGLNTTITTEIAYGLYVTKLFHSGRTTTILPTT